VIHFAAWRLYEMDEQAGRNDRSQAAMAKETSPCEKTIARTISGS